MLFQNGLSHSMCKKQKRCLMVRKNYLSEFSVSDIFRLNCFIRSAAFSLGAMAFIVILLLLISPEDFLEMKDAFLTRHLG